MCTVLEEVGYLIGDGVSKLGPVLFKYTTFYT